MRRLVFATHNTGKLKEMRELLAGVGIEVVSAVEAGVVEEPEETGATFEENALIKARAVCAATGEWAVADDSGVMIEVLGGMPGVYSGRWAGREGGDKAIVRRTLEELVNVPAGKRQATFHSVVALVSPTGEAHTFDGTVKGEIALAPRGTPRPKLAYDVLFQPDGFTQTFAEMSDEQKNALSHRGRAFQKLKAFLLRFTRS